MIHNKDRLLDKEGKSFTITHNLTGNNIKNWAEQYKENENYRSIKRKDSILLTHEILSWHRDDAENITLPKLEEMAREYIRLRNLKGMFVAVPHFDKDHYHIHICASGIEYKTGKSLRLAKTDLSKLKKVIQQFQIDRFPELNKSIVQHGKNDKARISDKEFQLKLRTKRETNKEHLSAILKTCYKKANSRETFFELLKDCNVPTYERSGKTTGVVFNEIKFRFSRLGFGEERLIYLDRSLNRSKELENSRTQKEKNTAIEPTR